jgi:hypothetical protein
MLRLVLYSVQDLSVAESSKKRKILSKGLEKGGLASCWLGGVVKTSALLIQFFLATMIGWSRGFNVLEAIVVSRSKRTRWR